MVQTTSSSDRFVLGMRLCSRVEQRYLLSLAVCVGSSLADTILPRMPSAHALRTCHTLPESPLPAVPPSLLPPALLLLVSPPPAAAALLLLSGLLPLLLLLSLLRC
jgi:hypothetical protein